MLAFCFGHCFHSFVGGWVEVKPLCVDSDPVPPKDLGRCVQRISVPQNARHRRSKTTVRGPLPWFSTILCVTHLDSRCIRLDSPQRMLSPLTCPSTPVHWNQ